MPVVIVLIIAVLLIAGGLGSLLIGTDSVVPDRPLIAGLGGIIAIVGGCLMLGLALVLRELVALRGIRAATGRMDAWTSAPAAEAAPVAPVAMAPASQPAPARNEASLPGMAGAGALAAVAAAVGATTVLSSNRDEEPAVAPGRPPSPDLAARTVADAPMAETTAPLVASPAVGEDASHKESAKPLPAPADAAPAIDTPVPPQPEIEAELARESDPFNLQAEFDRLLDQAVSGAGPVEPITAQPDDNVNALEAEVAAVAEEDAAPLIKPAEPMSAEDKSQLEDLVRAAIEDAPQDNQADQLPEEPVPVVPPVATLRERIASALEPPDQMEPAPVEQDQVPETDVAMPAAAPAPQADSPASPDVAAPAATVTEPLETAQKPDNVSVPHDEADEPASPVEHVAEAAPAPEQASIEPSRSIVRTFSSGANHYTMYTDGSISADTPSGRYEFASFNELRAFIDTYKG